MEQKIAEKLVKQFKFSGKEETLLNQIVKLEQDLKEHQKITENKISEYRTQVEKSIEDILFQKLKDVKIVSSEYEEEILYSLLIKDMPKKCMDKDGYRKLVVTGTTFTDLKTIAIKNNFGGIRALLKAVTKAWEGMATVAPEMSQDNPYHAYEFYFTLYE